MLNQNPNHPGCSDFPETVPHSPNRSSQRAFRAIVTLRTNSFAAEPISTLHKSDDGMTLKRSSSPHRHIIVTRNFLILSGLQTGDDGDDENTLFFLSRAVAKYKK